eukprot:gene10767-3386_t
MTDYNDLLTECMDIAYTAGKRAIDYVKEHPLKVDEKPDNTFVTQVDVELNTFILERLGKKFPDITLVGEESTDKQNEDTKTEFSKGKYFFVDPIDGTSDFIKQTGDWCVMIGYCEDSDPKVGVIYHATEDIMYYGIKGTGSFSIKNGNKTQLNCNDCSLEEAVASVSSADKPKPLEIISKLKIEKKKVRGSMGLKSMDIAKGDANVYLNLSKKSSFWDSVAPTVILREANACLIYNLDTYKPIEFKGSTTTHKYPMSHQK